jgi:hypothetical protein
MARVKPSFSKEFLNDYFYVFLYSFRTITEPLSSGGKILYHYNTFGICDTSVSSGVYYPYRNVFAVDGI